MSGHDELLTAIRSQPGSWSEGEVAYGYCHGCGGLVDLTLDKGLVCRGPCDEETARRALLEDYAERLEASRSDRQSNGRGNVVTLTWAADRQPRRVRWAWAGRIPLGALSMLAGEEGLGKSQATIHIAARLTRGELDGDLAGDPGTVLFASAEDAIDEVIMPRLIASDADLAKVAFVAVKRDGVTGTLQLPDDVTAIASALDGLPTAARLLIIDPLVAHIPADHSTHRDQHVRLVLAPLAQLAADRDLAVVGVAHLNKGESERALKRVGGSVALTAAPRSVLFLGPDPDDPAGREGTARVLAHGKCNVGPCQPSLSLRIEGFEVHDDAGDVIETSRAVIVGESSSSADDLLQAVGADERSAKEEAQSWLTARLADGPVAAEEVKSDAAECSISETTLNRAKRNLGVKSVRPGGQGPWQWQLPDREQLTLGRPVRVADDAEPLAQPDLDGHASQGAQVDHLGHLAPGLGGQGDLDGQGGTLGGDGDRALGGLGGLDGQSGADDHLASRGEWDPEDAEEFIARAREQFPGSHEPAEGAA